MTNKEKVLKYYSKAVVIKHGYFFWIYNRDPRDVNSEVITFQASEEIAWLHAKNVIKDRFLKEKIRVAKIEVDEMFGDN